MPLPPLSDPCFSYLSTLKQTTTSAQSKAAAPGSTEGRDHGKSGEDRGREAGVSAAAAAGSGVESGGASERSDGRPAGSGEGEEGEFGFGDEADMERTIAKTLEMLAKVCLSPFCTCGRRACPPLLHVGFTYCEGYTRRAAQLSSFLLSRSSRGQLLLFGHCTVQ